ncbi:MAG: protein TolQ [Deltaproteobacteria bacterium]|nr:protein TolQ [Deltaproteobacteria bacterium]
MEPLHVMHSFIAQAGDSAAPPDYGFWSSIVNAGVVEKGVLVFLMVFSIISWAIIVFKYRTLRRAYSESEVFLDAFWSSKRLDAIYQRSESLSASPVSQVFRAGYIELAKLKKKNEGEADKDDTQLGALESVERSMRRAAAAELTALESLVPFLATSGSTSPFIGLFGTVIGIMNSFQDIGKMGNANLATVAPGIGGALVATAAGLFAAIPSVIAYNFFLSKIRVLDTEMQNFSSDFLNIIKRHFF